jgi:hypothetical protein
MKKFLIEEGERERIMNMHKTAIKKQYLSEQSQNEQSDPAMKRYEDRRKRNGYDSEYDIQDRLVILYMMAKGLSRLDAIKELNSSNFDSYVSTFGEPIMDWLETIGLERGDIFVDNNNKNKVLNKVKEIESLRKI